MTRTDLEDEPPLDPATERLRRKMLRLLAVSVATMLIAVMAVLAAVVYKVTARPAPDGPAPTIALDLPAGAAIEDMAIDGGEALLHLRAGSVETLLRVDLATGRVLARYRVGGGS